MDTTDLMSFFAVSLLLIVTPGPDWAFVLGHAFRRRPLLWPLLGIGLGYLGLTTVVAGGLGALVARHPALLTVITLAGIVVLLRIGWQMLRTALDGPVSVEVDTADPEAASGGGGVATLTRVRAETGVEKRTKVLATGAAVSMTTSPLLIVLVIAALALVVANRRSDAPWARSAGTYITPMVLGGPRDAMFANIVFETVITQLNWPLGSALSIVLLVVLGGIVTIYNRLVGFGQIARSFG